MASGTGERASIRQAGSRSGCWRGNWRNSASDRMTRSTGTRSCVATGSLPSKRKKEKLTRTEVKGPVVIRQPGHKKGPTPCQFIGGVYQGGGVFLRIRRVRRFLATSQGCDCGKALGVVSYRSNNHSRSNGNGCVRRISKKREGKEYDDGDEIVRKGGVFSSKSASLERSEESIEKSRTTRLWSSLPGSRPKGVRRGEKAVSASKTERVIGR